jgi:hypothetical protein
MRAKACDSGHITKTALERFLLRLKSSHYRHKKVDTNGHGSIDVFSFIVARMWY